MTAPPVPEPTPESAEWLADPACVRSELAALTRGVRGGWKIPEQLLDVLPGRVIEIAVNRNSRFKPREQLAAARLLTLMIKDNASLGPGSGGRGPSVAIQQNFHAGCEHPWIVSTQQQVADFFGNSPETVKDWRAKGMPGQPGGPGRAGQYDLRKILAWRDSSLCGSGREDSPRGPAGGPQDPDAQHVPRAEADRRRAVAEAQLKEVRAAEAAGRVVPIDRVLRVWQQHDSHLRAMLEQMPHRLLELLPEGSTPDDQRRFLAGGTKLVDDLVASTREAVLEQIGAEPPAEEAGETNEPEPRKDPA